MRTRSGDASAGAGPGDARAGAASARDGPGARLRVVTDPADPAVEAYAALLAGTFPDPDMVVDAGYLRARLAAEETRERVYFLLVAETGDDLVGGASFSYLPPPNTAYSGFLVLAPAARGRRLGRWLFDRRARLLREAARRWGQEVPWGLFIETVNPLRLTPGGLEAERLRAMDPVVRRRIFAHLGFRQVMVHYVQPPLRPGTGPVETMDLLFRPMHPDLSGAVDIPAALVLETLTRVWSGPREQVERYLKALAAGIQGDKVGLAQLEGMGSAGNTLEPEEPQR